MRPSRKRPKQSSWMQVDFWYRFECGGTTCVVQEAQVRLACSRWTEVRCRMLNFVHIDSIFHYHSTFPLRTRNMFRWCNFASTDGLWFWDALQSQSRWHTGSYKFGWYARVERKFVPRILIQSFKFLSISSFTSVLKQEPFTYLSVRVDFRLSWN